MLHTVLLGVHITAGTIGLLLGPLALAVPKRAGGIPDSVSPTRCRRGDDCKRTGSGGARPGPTVVAGADRRRYGGGGAGRVGMRLRHPSGWLGWHIRLMCGSYLSFITAALVVNWADPLARVLPTVIGTPLIIRAVKRATRPSIRPSTPPPRPVRSEMSA